MIRRRYTMSITAGNGGNTQDEIQIYPTSRQVAFIPVNESDAIIIKNWVSSRISTWNSGTEEGIVHEFTKVANTSRGPVYMITMDSSIVWLNKAFSHDYGESSSMIKVKEFWFPDVISLGGGYAEYPEIGLSPQMFDTNPYIERIHLGSQVRIIPEWFAFRCTSLTHVDITGPLSHIKEGAFSSDENLNKYTPLESFTIRYPQIPYTWRYSKYSENFTGSFITNEDFFYPQNLTIYVNPAIYNRFIDLSEPYPSDPERGSTEEWAELMYNYNVRVQTCDGSTPIPHEIDEEESVADYEEEESVPNDYEEEKEPPMPEDGECE